MVRFHNRRRLALRRPDKLLVETDGDTMNRHIWKKDDSIFILDHEHLAYTKLQPVPVTIEGLLDFAAQEYGIVIPLADLVHKNTYSTFSEGAIASEYLGIHTVNGFASHHLAFVGEEIDWQIWIDAGAKPIPRKLVIRYKNEDEQAQYEATILHWQETLTLKDSDFVFAPSPGMEKLEPRKILSDDPSTQKSPPRKSP